MPSPINSPTCKRGLTRYGGIFDYAVKADRLVVVNAELEDPNVWNDPKRAQDLGREKKLLEGTTLKLDHLKQHSSDTAELFEMAQMEDDRVNKRAQMYLRDLRRDAIIDYN